jgi:hypothetical protein
MLLNPSYTNTIKNIRYTLGANTYYHNDSIFGQPRLWAMPNLELEYTGMHRFFVRPYIRGDITKVHINTAVDENNFINTNPEIHHKVTPYRVGLASGIKAFGIFNIGIEGSYGLDKNMYYYVNNRQERNKLDLIYDKKGTKLFTGILWIEMSIVDKVYIKNINTIYNYQTSSDIVSYIGRPLSTSNLNLGYKITNGIKDKPLYISSNIYYLSGIKGLEANGNIQNLKPILDVNIRAEHKHSELFTIYVEANNILTKKYQEYMYYPTQSLNVMAGVTYGF